MHSCREALSPVTAAWKKSGSGTLTVSNTTLTQKAVNLNEGTLTLNDSTVTTDVIAQRGTALKLTGSTVLNGAIDPTNVTLASGATEYPR